MNRGSAPEFPVASLPGDTATRRLLGIYEQRQEPLSLQRIRILGGRLPASAWRALAEAAGEVGARDALHLTTRQSIEIHDLQPESVPVLQRRIAEAGLTTIGAAGDTVRGMTVDPEGGLVAGVWDLLPLARATEVAMGAVEGLWSLPRKFKISFSGSERGAMRPWVSDIGLIAEPSGSLTAVVGGSLGARPASGIKLDGEFSSEEAIALTVAAIKLHDRQGDRTNRSRARLRHVRERLGDSAFLGRLHTLLAEELARPCVHDRSPFPSPEPRGDFPFVRLSVPHGDLPLRLATELAESVEKWGGEIRIGIEHDLYVCGVLAEKLPREVSEWADRCRLVACPGSALCPRAVGSTTEAADALRPLARSRPEMLFAISGCPNSCSHTSIADVGLVARPVRGSGSHEPVFRLFLGGERGSGPGLATLAAEAVPLSQLADTVAELLAGRDAVR